MSFLHTRALSLLLLLLTTMVSGCSSYPLGMDEDTWKRLPEQERIRLAQLDARQKQQQRLAELEAEKEKARLQAEVEKEKWRAWRTLFSRLQHGQIIQLSLLKGEARTSRWRPIQPDSFMLPLGAEETLRLHTDDGQPLTLWAAYRPGKVLLCSRRPSDAFEQGRLCRVFIDEQWAHGQRYRFSLPQPWNRKKTLLRGTLLIRSLPVRPR